MFRAVGCVEVYRIDVRCILFLLLYLILLYTYIIYCILYYPLPFLLFFPSSPFSSIFCSSSPILFYSSSIPLPNIPLLPILSFILYVSVLTYTYLYYHPTILPRQSIYQYLKESYLPSFPFQSSNNLILSFKVYVSVLTYTYLYSFQISDPACFIGVDG